MQQKPIDILLYWHIWNHTGLTENIANRYGEIFMINSGIDLHVHSTASDGQYTPTQLVHMAKMLGLSVLSITDHDTIAGLDEAKAAACEQDIQWIAGIELDSKYPGIEGNFHILGYGIDWKHPVLKTLCADLSAQRQERAQRIFSYLEQRGVCPSRQRVYDLATNSVIGRPHFARAMVEERLVSDTKEAFNRYLDTPEFQKIDRTKPHPREAIRMIIESGGIAALAHPSQLKLNGHSFETLLEELKEYGMGGIECYYSTHTRKQTQDYLYLAEKMELYVTGGSDYHGELIKPDIQLGSGINNSLQIPDTLKILEKVNR